MTATVGVLDVYGPASPPRSNGELVFSQPWESRAFGLALALHAGGAFEWEDFRRELIATISVWENDPQGAWSYYRCWLAALESVLAATGVVAPHEVEDRSRLLAERPAGHDHGHDHGAGGHGHDHGNGNGRDGHGGRAHG